MLPEILAITVEDFYKECYRIANTEKNNHCKRSPLSFARYINVKKVMVEYIQNKEECPESSVNSFDHNTFSHECIENEEQLKWFLMAFVEVGFEYNADTEIDVKSSSSDDSGSSSSSDEEEKTDSPKYSGSLNQYVDEDNQFDEGMIQTDFRSSNWYETVTNDQFADQFSFNYIQDHPDETKLKTYDLSYFTSTIGRTKEELIAEMGEGSTRHRCSSVGSGKLHTHTSEADTNNLAVDISNPSFVEEHGHGHGHGNSEEKESNNQSERAKRVSKVVRARANSAESMLGLVPSNISNPSNETKTVEDPKKKAKKERIKIKKEAAKKSKKHSSSSSSSSSSSDSDSD